MGKNDIKLIYGLPYVRLPDCFMPKSGIFFLGIGIPNPYCMPPRLFRTPSPCLVSMTPCHCRFKILCPYLVQRFKTWCLDHKSKTPCLGIHVSLGICALISKASHLFGFENSLKVLNVNSHPFDGLLERYCSKSCTHHNLIDQKHQMKSLMNWT